MEPKKYYMRDTRQYVGNCLLWWTEGGGYTTDLEDAEQFTEARALAICSNRKTDKAYRIADMQALSRRHVDHQDIQPDMVVEFKNVPKTKP